MKKTFLAIPLVVLAPLLGACASLSAKAPPERPTLVVPPAPPRIIEAVSELPPEPVPDLPAPTGTPPPVSPPRSGRGSTRENGPKPDPKPAEVKPVEPAPQLETPPPPAAPAAQLRTPQTADTSSAAKILRTTIDAARGILNTVNFGTLSNERKKAYNDAKLLLQQAEDGLKEGNLVFAQPLATKAETLAKGLAGR